jgi:hypothetical protein
MSADPARLFAWRIRTGSCREKKETTCDRRWLCDFIAEGPRDEEFIAKYAVMHEEGETRAREAGEGGEVMNQAVKELKAAVTAELSCK